MQYISLSTLDILSRAIKESKVIQFVVMYLMFGGTYPILYVGRAIIRRVKRK